MATESGPPPPMMDPFARAITYLRVSVTDRCDFRCVYCMAENMTFLPKQDLLTLEGLDRLCSAFVAKGGRGMDLTLIEVRPLGDIGEERLAQYLPLSLVRAQLAGRFTFEDIDYLTGSPARYVRVKETGGRLGFITPMTHNFCESCNRVRITCTGTLYMCLGQEDAADLRAPLRASESNDLLNAAIDEAIARKPKGHDFIIDRRHRRPAIARHMSVTGG
jgi:molybdenum cofactor biosynthesis enzyme MoaA